MKSAFLILSFLMYANVSIAGDLTITATWDQPAIEAVDGWLLSYGFEPGNRPHIVDIPKSEVECNEADPGCTKQAILDPVDFNGKEQTTYFSMCAYDAFKNLACYDGEVSLFIDRKAPDAPTNFNLVIVIE
jgi:hypothetical protein